MTEARRRRWAIRFGLVTLIMVSAGIARSLHAGWVLSYLLAVGTANPLIMLLVGGLAFVGAPLKFGEVES